MNDKLLCCELRDLGALSGEDHARQHPVSHPPRVLARITEENLFEQGYRVRCETCPYTNDSWSLSCLAGWARDHVVRTGHAVLVEAL